MNENWRVFAHWDGAYQDYELVLMREDHEGRGYVSKIEMTRVDRHGYFDKPKIFQPGEAGTFMQAVMDAAWEAGLRPRGFKDHTNELTAVRYHLEDMRKLAKVNK